MNRSDVIKIAEQAGYGIVHYGRAPTDGVTVDQWEKHVWGGPAETARLERFAQLVLQHANAG